MMKKKVIVITYCACGSIGSILQAYALTKTLNECGNECTLWLEEWNRTVSQKKLRSAKDCAKWIYKKFYSGKFDSAYRKKLDFVAGYMDAEYFSDWEAFHQKALENRDNIFLTGSDQVWNLDLCRPLFFLDFAGTSKRISYAASMGQTKIPPQKEEIIKEWLGSFDHISVRERECKDVLQPIAEQEISVHIDPTFLVDAEDWRALEKSYKVKGPYILLYMLYWDPACRNRIIDLKKRTGFPVYAICPDVSRVYADKHLYDVGIEEFLWLVDHAEYVITSSFHGVAFSIIFQKKFAVIINPTSPSRIENLLRILDVPRVGINELCISEPFNYSVVHSNIEKERQRSMAYLKEAIE
jgi:hypothetical protein